MHKQSSKEILEKSEKHKEEEKRQIGDYKR